MVAEYLYAFILGAACQSLLHLMTCVTLGEAMHLVVERRSAEERALDLLWTFLDDEQRRMYEERSCIPVTGSESGFRWILSRERNYNIYCGLHALCAVPTDFAQLPQSDLMLAQMLALRHNEREIVGVANIRGRDLYNRMKHPQSNWDYLFGA